MDKDTYILSKFNETLSKQNALNKQQLEYLDRAEEEQIEEAAWGFIQTETSLSAKNGKKKMSETTTPSTASKKCWEVSCNIDRGAIDEEINECGKEAAAPSREKKITNGRKQTSSPPKGRRKSTPITEKATTGRKPTNKKKEQLIKGNTGATTKSKHSPRNKVTNVPRPTTSIKGRNVVDKQNGERLIFYHCQVSLNMV